MNPLSRLLLIALSLAAACGVVVCGVLMANVVVPQQGMALIYMPAIATVTTLAGGLIALIASRGWSRLHPVERAIAYAVALASLTPWIGLAVLR